MAKKVSKPKQKDRNSTEARLIEAAAKVFSQVGFEGATTRMIAQEADSNISLINRYFEGKYGLLLALIKKKSEHMKVEKLDYPPQESIEQELVRYSASFLNTFFLDVEFFKVCLGQFLSDAKFLKKYRDILTRDDVNPELLERLNVLIARNKMKINIEQTLKDVEIYIFGLFVINYLIVGESEKDIFITLENFVLNYTAQIKK